MQHVPPQPDPQTLAALQKQRSGQRLNQREQSRIRRYKDSLDEASRWRHYAEIPKGHWAKLSGRQHKVLDEQAALYGIPLSGPTIDLAAVARWIHDTLATKGDQLREAADLPPDTRELLDAERLRRARLENAEAEARLLPRDTVHGLLQILAARLRQAGDQLQKGFGQGALDIHLDCLADVEALIEQLPRPPAQPNE